MKKFLVASVLICFHTMIAFAESNDPATQQAREDYRTYLQELKKINEQYKEVTSQMKEVLREEGIPVWNETTGEIEFQKGLGEEDPKNNIKENETEMTVIIDLPGIKKQDVQVKIEDGRFLKVDAKRDSVPVIKLIQLPAPADPKSVPKASLENGVLTVKIVKAPQIKTQVVIPVQ